VVLEALYAYRNTDGGFGWGIEPDVRWEGSTVLGTTMALQTLVRIKADGYHPLVQGAMRYLVEQYDLRTGNWALVNEGAKAVVGAPWWRGYEPSQPGELNPRAEILSYFVRFDHGQHAAMAEEVRRRVISRLSKEEPLEMHEAQCVARLLRTPGIDSTLERACREALERDLGKLLPKTREECAGYVLKPMTIARRPNSVLAGLVEHAVPVQHEYELSVQGKDGSWGPSWSWSDQDPAGWAEAERDWKSLLTMFTASSLFAYSKA
jgi:hypothetical protein